MSCQECMYISGHAPSCSVGVDDRLNDIEYQIDRRVNDAIAALRHDLAAKLETVIRSRPPTSGYDALVAIIRIIKGEP